MSKATIRCYAEGFIELEWLRPQVSMKLAAAHPLYRRGTKAQKGEKGLSIVMLLGCEVMTFHSISS